MQVCLHGSWSPFKNLELHVKHNSKPWIVSTAEDGCDQVEYVYRLSRLVEGTRFLDDKWEHGAYLHDAH